MAVDEAILDNALEGASPPTIRFFQWEVPSITFGYMLKVGDELNVPLCEDRGVPFIRRITGGGVVFHKCDITFSIVFPRGLAPETTNPLSSYRFINTIFLRAFEKLGLTASLLDQDGGKSPDKRNICFVEPSTYDVLYAGRKLVGNAQRRRKGWVLNHGSMLFDQTYKAMVDLVPGFDDPSKAFAENSVAVNEIAPHLDRSTIISEIAMSLSNEIGVKVIPGDLSPRESDLAETLSREKYSTPEWNLHRRHPNHTAE